MKQKIIIIAGPTAVGKTQIAIEIAKEFEAEIINADSRQFYKEMSIGTAKPSVQDQKECPFHLVDCASIHTAWSVSDFVTHAKKAIADINQRNKIPIIVGGTGMYLKALLYGLDEIPKITKNIQNQVQNEYKTHGIDWIYKMLCEKIPQTTEYLNQNNTQRILRAYSVYLQTQKGIHEFWKQDDSLFNSLFIILDLPRKELYTRIDTRVLHMIENGLQEEVQKLCKTHPDNLILQKTIGYAEWQDHSLQSKDDIVQKIQQNTRHFAKRQLTWFRSQEHTKWLHPQDIQSIKENISQFLQNS